MNVVKNKSTDNGRQFWSHVESIVRQVRNLDTTSDTDNAEERRCAESDSNMNHEPVHPAHCDNSED